MIRFSPNSGSKPLSYSNRGIVTSTGFEKLKGSVALRIVENS
jgi:hypothetical protein